MLIRMDATISKISEVQHFWDIFGEGGKDSKTMTRLYTEGPCVVCFKLISLF